MIGPKTREAYNPIDLFANIPIELEAVEELMNRKNVVA